MGRPAIAVEDETLASLLASSGAPDRLVVTDTGGALDLAQFRGRVSALAAQLEDCGVGRGSAVALWLPNGATYLAAIFATARLGALAMHVNTRFGAAEITDVLQRTRAQVLVLRTDFAALDVAAVLGELGETRLRTLICDGPTLALPHLHGVDVAPLAKSGGQDNDGAGQGSDACLTYTTSGATARPKLVVHTQRSIVVHARQVATRVAMDETGAYLAAVPFCGTFGNCAAMAAVAAGAHLVCMDAFDPEAADTLIRRHAITHTVGDDRMLGRLAATALAGRGPHRTMRFFGVAAFHPDMEISCARGVEAGLAPHAIYGSSEVQALYAIGRPADGGLGAVTPVSPQAQVEIAGEEGEATRGELRLGGPSLFSGYLDDPDAGATALTEAGLFRAGDLAVRVGDGFVFEGRMGDVLRLGGFLVNPAEIEAFLQAQPGVSAAAVVGVEQDTRRVAFAFVIPQAGARLEEATLLASCRRRLARYKTPVRAVAVDSFPYSQGPNGPKIVRAALRTRALQMLGEARATGTDGSGERIRI